MLSLSIKWRLILGFSLLILIILVGAGVTMTLTGNAESQTRRLIDGRFESFLAAESARAAFYNAAADARDFLYTGNSTYVDAGKRHLASTRGYLTTLEISSDHNISREGERIVDLVQDYENVFDEMVALMKRRGLSENEGLQGAFRGAVHSIEETVSEQNLDELSVLMLMARRHEKDYMLRGDKKYINRISQRIGEFEETINARSMPAAVRADMMGKWEAYRRGINQLVQADDQIAGRRADFDRISDELTAEIDQLQETLEAGIASDRDFVLNTFNLMSVTQFSVLAISIVVSTLTTAWIVVSITRPISSASDQVKGVVAGDLTVSMASSSGDEIGLIMQDIESMRARLLDVLSGIRSSAFEVQSASDQVSQGNTQLSQRTQAQASALEEVAASMEELLATVKQNADNSVAANQMAQDASLRAEEGQQVVADAVTAMSQISESSLRIQEIIAVIDDISFQINLLALNAAVEAARAGEQGRGFSVVAGEVRNLAGRSAAAAKEIRELIQDSVGKVEEGTELVNQSGNTLFDIVEAVKRKRVSDTVAEIAAASQEQSDGISQVNRALVQMDQMTQENASLVEEVAASAESMEGQAADLSRLVSFFKLDDNGARASKAAQRQQDSIVTLASRLTGKAARNRGASSQGALLLAESQNVNEDDWERF